MWISRYCIIRNQTVVTADGREQLSALTLEDFLTQLYHHIGASYPKFYKMDPQSRLGWLAAEMVLGIKQTYQGERVSVLLSNRHASLDTDIRFQESMAAMASPSLFVYTLPNVVSGEICIRHGLKGENAFFITERFDALMMATYTAQVLAQNHVDCCLAGWVDVLGEAHDVFLYLVEKQPRGRSLPHNAQELEKLYIQ